jgi:histidinol dehydrogenase
MKRGTERGIERGVGHVVGHIVARVRRDGDAALRLLTRRYDGAHRRRIEVGAAERRAGARRVEPETDRALRFAAARIGAFARLQKRSLRPLRSAGGGVILEQRLLPIDSVGVYVPGGRHPLCSTVLMGALPARIAGCRRVILCTPPRRDGTLPPEILAAAALARVDRVFAVGGAQAIAAMAFGTGSIPAVDLIVGPGNRYVAAAKSLVSGAVGIDFVAGPSELLVIADRTADPLLVAADLAAQAEHDPAAVLYLVAIGRGVAPPVRRALHRLIEALPAGGPNRTAAARAASGLRIIAVAGRAAACAAADRVAPEHLSIQARAPRSLARRLRNYGSLFVGAASAVAFGDYVSGPSHILPTAGHARWSGGLSVLRFLKAVTVQEIGPAGARRLGRAAERLAKVEGLLAHAASIRLRRWRPERDVRRRPGGRMTSMRRLRAVLFDFDGVLVDSETFHFRAFREVLKPLGVRLTRKAYDDRYLAFDDRNAIIAMLRDARRGARPPRPAGGAAAAIAAGGVDELVRRKRTRYRRLCGARLRVGRSEAAFVRAVVRRVPTAIVSGAARDEILLALRRGGLGRAFRAIVAAGEVPRPKPHPDGYRRAMRLLRLGRGRDCVAIEDSPGGIAAARAAGLPVIGISTSYPAAALRRAGAWRVVPAVARLDPDDLLPRER